MLIKTSIKLGLIICVAVASIVLVCAVAGMSPHRWNHLADSPARAENASHSASGRTRVEGELIVLRPFGFQPREIRRHAGQPFLLAVENQSSLPMSSLTLKSDVGLPIRDAIVPREQRMWSDVLNLPPGTFTLAEANHGDWTCTIIVETGH